MTDEEKKAARDLKISQLLKRLVDADFDLYAFMNLAVKEVQDLTNATGVVVELVDGDEMVYSAVSGVMEQYIGLRLKRHGSLSGLCVEKAEVLICNDSETDDRVDREACRRVHARSMVVAPLFQQRRAVGGLKIISDKPNSFTAEDVDTLQQVARALGFVLANQIYQDVRKFF